MMSFEVYLEGKTQTKNHAYRAMYYFQVHIGQNIFFRACGAFQTYLLTSGKIVFGAAGAIFRAQPPQWKT